MQWRTSRSKHVTALAPALAAMSMYGSAFADPVGELTTFTAGTPAHAEEVNGNFAEVADSVDDNDMRLTTVESDVADLPPAISALENRLQDVAAAALAVVDADGTVVGPLLDVRPGRLLLEIDGVYVSVGVSPLGLNSDPSLVEQTAGGFPLFPEAQVSFTGPDCTGDAYYSSSAAQLSRLVEFGIAVGGRVYARDATLGLPVDPSEEVQFAAQSYYTVAGNPEAPALTCVNSQSAASGIPAISRAIDFAAPLAVQTR